MTDNQKSWEIIRSEAGPDYRIFRVRWDWAVSPRTGEEGHYVVLECPNWVNIIAVTDENQVVLVRQYRHGIGTEALEIPAGMMDGSEEPLAAARRELLEETGYGEGRWTFLGKVRPNAAFQDNWCYSFLAEGVYPVGQPCFDEGEAIEVEIYPLSEIPALVNAGVIDQSLVVSAFYLLDRVRQG